jgi:16S rRNA (cytidine1402-2'-O)-methyltransferase
MTKKTAALLLLPNLLGEHKHHEPFLPQSVDKAVLSLDGIIAETEKDGRRFLKRFHGDKSVHMIPITLFNEHTPDADIDFVLQPIIEGQRWGFVSDAGLPCIADPGSKLVKRARKLGLNIQSFVGPSSILTALMLSGFSGQKFTFHGYLPKDSIKLKKTFQLLEKQAQQEGSTQIFMEAPYRNTKTLEAMMETLKPETQVCIAWDLTLPTQGIVSQKVGVLKKSPLPNIDKKPTIFLISAEVDND